MILLLLATLLSIDDVIPEGSFSYPGSPGTKRETIIVEPENSPLLNAACEKIAREVSVLDDEIDILQTVLLFVADELFRFQYRGSVQTDMVIKHYTIENQTNEIPLEFFLNEKIGSCRHLALTSSYLLQALVQKKILSGKAFFIRDNTNDGRHAWSLYLNEKGAWHLDPTRNLLINARSPQGYHDLCIQYGKKTMERQKKRWEDAD